MKQLFEKLQDDALKWRKEGYLCSEYPLIGEILRYQFEDETSEYDRLKYLRVPQFHALELYWFLRLKHRTPHIVDLYKYYYDDKGDFCKAFGIPIPPGQWITDIDTILERVKTDSDFIKDYSLDAVHEAVTLPYPSYIFALTMGTGKTVLISTIIATEFSMALQYRESDYFMENALVFAPGTTIIGSLREISEVPYEQILPPNHFRDFRANLKITYPQPNAKDIQVQQKSSWNVIVTNTEKISLRAKTNRSRQMSLLRSMKKDEQAELEANYRLEKITSLPNLGIFSDEAHHTYGNRMDKDLKRMRETVNYINNKTKVRAVLNTTGTPYYKRQMLREVIAWYSLSDGIRDNILKNITHGVVQFPVVSSSDKEQDIIRDIIKDFFNRYGDVKLSKGSKAKIAFYFKTQEHLNASRAHIQNVLIELEENIDQILVNTQQSTDEEEAEFNRLNDHRSQKRIILLIGRGGEGWNCPSLFACALIKEQTSRTFVLQASTRCLRQVKGNTYPARIYLSVPNKDFLDKELQDNFGIGVSELTGIETEIENVVMHIRKNELPKLTIRREVRRVVRNENASVNVQLSMPTDVEETPRFFRSILTPDFTRKDTMFTRTNTSNQEEIDTMKRTTDCYSLAQSMGKRYHLSIMETLKKLKQLYPDGEVPNPHLYPLHKQVESQTQNYSEIKEVVTEALALIRTVDSDGNPVFDEEDDYYVHHLRLNKSTADRMRRHNLLYDEIDQDTHNVSFHYAPYNFDSIPERQSFENILGHLRLFIDDVNIFLFTGGITNTKKTDFHFEYKGEDGNYHRYFPDFVIVKNTGEFYIVEIKNPNEKQDPIVQAKKKAVEKLKDLQIDAHFEYEIIYAPIDENNSDMDTVIEWINKTNENIGQEETQQ